MTNRSENNLAQTLESVLTLLLLPLQCEAENVSELQGGNGLSSELMLSSHFLKLHPLRNLAVCPLRQ